MPNGSKIATSLGYWYREFGVPGGSLTLSFPVSANAASFGVNNWASAGLDFTASETAWALFVDSDRAPTFRREIDPQTGIAYPFPNGLALDGNYYADTAADVTVFEWGLDATLTETTITGYLLGAWNPWPTTSVEWSISGLALLNGMNPLSKVVWAPGYDLAQAQTPLGLGVATVSAFDTQTQLTDEVSYILRVHFPAEKVEARNVYSGWLHQSPPPYETVRASYNPGMISMPIVNAGPRPINVTYTYNYSYTWTYGWRYTLQQSISLGLEIAEFLFGSEQEINSNDTYNTSSGVQISITLYPEERFIFWGIPSGQVIDWLTSRWERHGFATDTSEVVTQGVFVEGIAQTTSRFDPITPPT